MRKIQLFGLCISALALITSSCSNQGQYCTDNDLIPKEVKVKYEQNLVVPDGSDAFKSIDRKDFVDKVLAAALTGKVKLYDQLDLDKQLSSGELNKIVGTWNDTLVGIDEKKVDTTLVVRQMSFNKDELARILFVEKWYFNSQRFVMTKDVEKWCPVRVYQKQVDSVQSEEIKKMLFWVKQETDTNNRPNLTLLKENVSYEFNLTNESVPEWLTDLNSERFVSIILDNVLAGRVVAYDYFDQKKRLSNKEIRESLGETVKEYFVENKKTGGYDTVQVFSKFFPEEITSVLFVEDWFIDWNTLRIEKKVKSIAPIRKFMNYHENGDEEIEKKIPFIVHLN